METFHPSTSKKCFGRKQLRKRSCLLFSGPLGELWRLENSHEQSRAYTKLWKSLRPPLREAVGKSWSLAFFVFSRKAHPAHSIPQHTARHSMEAISAVVSYSYSTCLIFRPHIVRPSFVHCATKSLKEQHFYAVGIPWLPYLSGVTSKRNSCHKRLDKPWAQMRKLRGNAEGTLNNVTFLKIQGDQ